MSLLNDARIANSLRYGNYVYEALLDSLDRSEKQTEDKDKATLSIDMPGVDKDNLKISVENGLLVIKGKRVDSEKVYSHTYSLSSSIDADKISATIKNGVLTIDLGKKNSSKNIQING